MTERCPTCGSDDKEKRGKGASIRNGFHSTEACKHKWHDSPAQPSPEPTRFGCVKLTKIDEPATHDPAPVTATPDYWENETHHWRLEAASLREENERLRETIHGLRSWRAHAERLLFAAGFEKALAEEKAK